MKKITTNFCELKKSDRNVDTTKKYLSKRIIQRNIINLQEWKNSDRIVGITKRGWSKGITQKTTQPKRSAFQKMKKRRNKFSTQKTVSFPQGDS